MEQEKSILRMKTDKYHYMSPFWNGLGWCLIWIGFGSCVYLTNHESDKPIVQIENSFNQKQ